MDIEGFVRRSLGEEDEKTVQKNLVNKILEFKDLDNEKANLMASAVIEEVKNTLQIDSYPDEFMRDLIKYNESCVSMGDIGVGSRGAGDFFVHRKIAEIVSSTQTSSYISPSAQDDGGVVKSKATGEDVYITTAVDGIHSRLSEYPFLGGFHVARATLRDVCVMGADPIAMLSDSSSCRRR